MLFISLSIFFINSWVLDLTTRQTMWNVSVGLFPTWVAHIGLNQSCVQRILALPTINHARKWVYHIPRRQNTTTIGWCIICTLIRVISDKETAPQVKQGITEAVSQTFVFDAEFLFMLGDESLIWKLETLWNNLKIRNIFFYIKYTVRLKILVIIGWLKNIELTKSSHSLYNV